MTFASFWFAAVESGVAVDASGVAVPMIGSDASLSVLGELSDLKVDSSSGSLLGTSQVPPFGSVWISKNLVLA